MSAPLLTPGQIRLAEGPGADLLNQVRFSYVLRGGAVPPWLPRDNWIWSFGLRRERERSARRQERPMDARELRWLVEDEWLMQQWALAGP